VIANRRPCADGNAPKTAGQSKAIKPASWYATRAELAGFSFLAGQKSKKPAQT
jgi:hypothetical protein